MTHKESPIEPSFIDRAWDRARRHLVPAGTARQSAATVEEHLEAHLNAETLRVTKAAEQLLSIDGADEPVFPDFDEQFSAVRVGTTHSGEEMVMPLTHTLVGGGTEAARKDFLLVVAQMAPDHSDEVFHGATPYLMNSCFSSGHDAGDFAYALKSVHDQMRDRMERVVTHECDDHPIILFIEDLDYFIKHLDSESAARFDAIMRTGHGTNVFVVAASGRGVGRQLVNFRNRVLLPSDDNTSTTVAMFLPLPVTSSTFSYPVNREQEYRIAAKLNVAFLDSDYHDGSLMEMMFVPVSFGA
ncbi:hypothetical protein FQ330_03215 [Agrococcus sediminis]|uniref:Uncharacterized protein n=1 Tax=Agrococcus sediminis TaxID=2599924 RepID=A0A5M8QME1_9MICO|nr:hypothetical protein [Agrococcus sediminis]KAA6436428.1 hypothetical protein FQ330_03215 [Agrococcus sediminis]